MIELRSDRLARGEARYSLRNSVEFKEDEHPRAEDGKFGSGGSSKEEKSKDENISEDHDKKSSSISKITPEDIPATMKKYGIDGSKPITIYHGSKSKFNKIDLSKTGSANATTEGWGSYLSADSANAKRFGDNIHKIKLKPEDMGKFLDINKPMSQQTPYVKEHLAKVVKQYGSPSDEMITLMTFRLINDPVFSDTWKKEKWFSELSLKSVRSSPDKIKDTIDSIDDKNIQNYVRGKIYGNPDISGYELYNKLTLDWNSKKKASEALNYYGLIGLVMPSRADMHSVKESANFVVFDQDFLDSEKIKNNSQSKVTVYRHA